MYSWTNKKRKIPISHNNQAVFPYGKYGFPCELFFDNIDDFDNSNVNWHWQLELEFSIVQKGSIELQVQKNTLHIAEGEGYIIFPNKLHEVRKHKTNVGIYKTIIADPKLIYGDNASILFHKYYLPVLATLPQGFMLFNKGTLCNKKIMDELDTISDLLIGSPKNYELEIHKCFLDIWAIIYDSIQNISSVSNTSTLKDENLTKKILLFIHTNYSYDISLAEIASSGNISKTECNRLFQRSLSCTPFEYLINYRISKSQEYLANDNYTITEIAQMAGFNSVN